MQLKQFSSKLLISQIQKGISSPEWVNSIKIIWGKLVGIKRLAWFWLNKKISKIQSTGVIYYNACEDIFHQFIWKRAKPCRVRASRSLVAMEKVRFCFGNKPHYFSTDTCLMVCNILNSLIGRGISWFIQLSRLWPSGWSEMHQRFRNVQFILQNTYYSSIVASRAPSQYKDRLIYVWRFLC